MKVTVKTLKGGKFDIECSPAQSVLDVKGLIESTNAELPAENMKLIHSGKVLKDDQTIDKCGIKPTDFLVVMVTKPKKAAAAPAPVATATAAAAAAPATAETPKAAATSSSSTDAEKKVETPAVAPAASDAPGAPSRSVAEPEFNPEVVSNLTSMGFPEDMVRACLRAASGNADVAVEFLTNGIPPGMEAGAAGASGGGGGSSSSSGGETLSGLRNHPQFNDLRRLVQSNPGMLQTVLTQIGQQQPDLLAEINANQETFLQMMNEPIDESAPAAQLSGGGGSGAGAGAGGMEGIPAGLMDGMANPAQMAQLIQNMNPNELNQMATMMGLSPEQLRTTAQMLQQIPPEQLQQYMAQAMQGGGGGGPQVLRLTEEEMAAVNRLADMGFDRTEAAQAYLACDKNEALAANLLMDGGFGDGGGGGGFGFGDGGGDAGGGSGGGSGSGSGNQDNGSGNEGDDMYD